jgi:hypothetical protein
VQLTSALNLPFAPPPSFVGILAFFKPPISAVDGEDTEALRFQLLTAEGAVIADLRAENAEDKEGWLTAFEKVMPLHAAAMSSSAHELQGGSLLVKNKVGEAIGGKEGGAEIREAIPSDAAHETI